MIGCLTCRSNGLMGGPWPMNMAIYSRPSPVSLKVWLRETTSPLFWSLCPMCTYTTMAMTIAETSEDDTQAYSTKSQHWYVVWNEAKSMLLTNQEITTQPQRPARSLPTPWVLSLESFSNIYAGPSSCLNVSLLFNILFLQYFSLFYLPFLSYLCSATIC